MLTMAQSHLPRNTPVSTLESGRDRIPFRSPFLKTAEHRPDTRQALPPQFERRTGARLLGHSTAVGRDGLSELSQALGLIGDLR